MPPAIFPVAHANGTGNATANSSIETTTLLAKRIDRASLIAVMGVAINYSSAMCPVLGRVKNLIAEVFRIRVKRDKT
jgi:hypothetical protein